MERSEVWRFFEMLVIPLLLCFRGTKEAIDE
jgi:hypothetical protein